MSLAHREWEVVTIVPIASLRAVAWAAVGLVDMLNSGGAVVASRLEDGGAAAGGVRGVLLASCAGGFADFVAEIPNAARVTGCAPIGSALEDCFNQLDRSRPRSNAIQGRRVRA